MADEFDTSFATILGAINQTKQTNLNRDIASSNISFRNQQSDLAQRQFDAEQKQREFDNQLNRADKAFDMGVSLLPLVPPANREGLMNEINSAYSQVTGKEYTPLQFIKFPDARATMHALAKEPEKAAEFNRQFQQQALPGDPNVQKLTNEFLTNEYHNKKDDSGSMVGLYKLGRVTSQSQFDRVLAGDDKEQARALQAKKDNGEIEVVPDDHFMAYKQAADRDARLSVLDPKDAEKLIKLHLGTLDPSQLSGEAELDQLIHTNHYFTTMDRIDAMLQANIVPPMSLYRDAQRSAALSGNKNLPSPILSEQDREAMLASKARRDHLTKRNELISAQVNETSTGMAKTLAEIEKIGTQIDNIKQDTANDKIAGESALLATQSQRRQMEATAPQKLQRIAEIDQELEDIDKVQGNPPALGQFGQEEVEALQDREDLLKLEKQVMEDEIAFAGNKDPALVFEKREALRASTSLAKAKIDDLKTKLKSNGKELNDLQLSRLANLDQKTQIEADKFKGEQLTNQLSNQIDPNDPNALRQAQDLIRNTPGADQLTNPKRVVDAAGGSSKGSGEAKGNTIFESASQAVKDVLLSKPGDLMHKATWRDVADAHRQVHLDRIEVQVGAMTAKKDQEVIRSAGEIFGIIDTFKDLGQSLFTDNEFLRLSGVQGAKQTFESYRQKDPRVKEYIRLREGLAGHLSRIGGERGMMTEGDIERAKNFVPDPTAFVPDSLETFNNMMRDFEQFVTNKVRGRFDERAVSALRGGSTSDRQEANSVEDILTEARKRAGVE